jgi:hypothetical protein
MLILLSAACQPVFTRSEVACERPAAGEIYVGPSCDAMIPANGEGRSADTAIANAWFRAIIRHPMASLTRPGVGGGTVVDIAPWDAADPVQEIIPIVGGGALDVDGFELEDDGVRAEGTIVPLPDAPSEAGRGEFRWVIEADQPILQVEGADGLWIHPRGPPFTLQCWNL